MPEPFRNTLPSQVWSEAGNKYLVVSTSTLKARSIWDQQDNIHRFRYINVILKERKRQKDHPATVEGMKDFQQVRFLNPPKAAPFTDSASTSRMILTTMTIMSSMEKA
jgi:hypothetical protein